MVNFKGGHVFSFTVDFSTFIVLLPCFEAVLLSFIYQIKLLCHLGLTSRKHMRIVQCDIYAFVSQTAGNIYGEKPMEIKSDTCECPYGIITTNRKSPVGSRVLRFSV